MLVLSRKLGEQVVIGNCIYVTVVAVRGNQVRLGFSAPEEVSIRREELGPCLENERRQRRWPDSYAEMTAPEVQS